MGWDDCLMWLVRELLLLFNCGVAVIGALLAAAAVYLMHQFRDTEEVALVQHEAVLSLLCVGVGVMALALFGCVGSLRKGSCAIRVYAVCLLALVCFEAAVTVSLLDYTGNMEDHALSGPLKEAVKCIWHDCCHASDASGASAAFEDCSVDADTCEELPDVFTSEESCALTVDEYEILIADWARDRIDPAIVILSAVGAIQLLAISFACCLAGMRRAARPRRDSEVFQAIESGRQGRRERSRYRQLRLFFSRKARRSDRRNSDLERRRSLLAEPPTEGEVPMAVAVHGFDVAVGQDRAVSLE